MKSGNFANAHDSAYELEEFAKITDSDFTQQTFSPHPALVKKTLVNGHRQTKDYHREPFNSRIFDLVEGAWDHEHCSVCFFTISDCHTYWENKNRIILLCDACYEAFKKNS